MGEAIGVEKVAGAITVPDLDSLGGQWERGGAACDEPEEFGDDGAEEDTFGGEKREDEGAVRLG